MKALLFAVAMCAAVVAPGETHELPVVRDGMPVFSIVACLDHASAAAGCEVRWQCASVAAWAHGIAPEHFSERVTIGRHNSVRIPDVWMTPPPGDMCAVNVEGEANVTAYREHWGHVSGEWALVSREELPVHRARSSVHVIEHATVPPTVLRYLLREYGFADLAAWADGYCSGLTPGGFPPEQHARCVESYTFPAVPFDPASNDVECWVDARNGRDVCERYLEGHSTRRLVKWAALAPYDDFARCMLAYLAEQGRVYAADAHEVEHLVERLRANIWRSDGYTVGPPECQRLLDVLLNG